MRFPLLLLLGVLAGGCSTAAEGSSDPDGGPAADAGTPTGDGAAPDAGPGATDAAGGPTFGDVSRAILAPRCTGCHDGGAFAPSPDLHGDLAYDRVVSAPSSLAGGPALVEPGDAEASYLYRKVAGTHLEVCDELALPRDDCGERMPRGTAAVPLGEGELSLVRGWIEAGAPR